MVSDNLYILWQLYTIYIYKRFITRMNSLHIYYINNETICSCHSQSYIIINIFLLYILQYAFVTSTTIYYNKYVSHYILYYNMYLQPQQPYIIINISLAIYIYLLSISNGYITNLIPLIRNILLKSIYYDNCSSLPENSVLTHSRSETVHTSYP